MNRLAIFVLCGFAVTLTAQQPAARFEVASVKPDPARQTLGYRPDPGKFSGNMRLIDFIALAYRTRQNRIVGPDWITRDYFSITGKVPGGARPADWIDMLRNLLEERFALKAHSEMRDMSVYALVKAREDGKLGPNLTAMNDCAREAQGKRPSCGGLVFGPGSIEARREWRQNNLLELLSQRVGRIVVDRTGLSGEFHLKLEFAEDPLGVNADVSALPSNPSLFSALQEQLGLKLESTTAPVDVLVIDAVSQPTPD